MTTTIQCGAMVGSKNSNMRQLTITVLAGGPSAEREVSLESGRAVRAALERLGHRVTMCDIDPDDLSALDREADFVFIALHGAFGEDGQLQSLLDARGLKYTGSGAEASRRAMDKAAAKAIFRAAGIPTPDYVVVRSGEEDQAVQRIGPPCVVKPVASGSSVDTSICRTEEELRRAAGDVAGKYGQALVERFVSAVELTVGVLGNEALPVCEIRTKRAFYDYQAKYVDDDTQYLFDLDLSVDLLRRVQEIGLSAHQALGCRVCSRVDVLVDRQTLEPFVLEVNTIPGFTSHSLVPKAAARIGVGFDALCQRIIELSMATPSSERCNC